MVDILKRVYGENDESGIYLMLLNSYLITVKLFYKNLISFSKTKL